MNRSGFGTLPVLLLAVPWMTVNTYMIEFRASFEYEHRQDAALQAHMTLETKCNHPSCNEDGCIYVIKCVCLCSNYNKPNGSRLQCNLLAQKCEKGHYTSSSRHGSFMSLSGVEGSQG